MCPDAHAHTHGVKGSASHPFTSEQREWTFNSNITKAPSHLGSKSVLISPDHTQSCLSYFLHLRNVIGRVNPHTWHALKITLVWSYTPKMHMYIFQTQKTEFSFCLWFFFVYQIASLLTAISYAVLLDKSLRQDTSKAWGILTYLDHLVFSCKLGPYCYNQYYILHLCLITWGRQLCWGQTDLLWTWVEIAVWIIHFSLFLVSSLLQ